MPRSYAAPTCRFEHNDESGRQRTQTIRRVVAGYREACARAALAGVLARMYGRGDVTDWRDKAGGTADKFFEIVDKLPDWKPPDNPSGWTFYGTAPQTQPRWTIKGIIPESGVGIFAGQWGVYKTTVALDLSVSVMTGLPFAGRYKVNAPAPSPTSPSRARALSAPGSPPLPGTAASPGRAVRLARQLPAADGRQRRGGHLQVAAAGRNRAALPDAARPYHRWTP